MNQIDKKVFSIFGNLNLINTISDKKKVKSMLNDFINCLCELYKIDKNTKIENLEIKEMYAKKLSDFFKKMREK